MHDVLRVQQIDNDAKRFYAFQDTIGKLNVLLGRTKTKTAETQHGARNLRKAKIRQGQGRETEELCDREEVLRRLLDIEADIEDLRLIKDIRDELHMMSNLFRRQEGVVQEMNQITQAGVDKKEEMKIPYKRHTHTPLTPPHAVVERNLKEVESLDYFAQKAGEAVQRPVLLELYCPQANHFVNRLSSSLHSNSNKLICC